MGSAFSCLASTFMYLGEFVENAFLAVGEIGAVLSRALIGIVVSLCDLLAAISCCYRVPWSQRPDRSFFTYSSQDNTQLATTNSSTLASVGGKQVLSSLLTKQGREQREEIKAARKKAAKVKAEKDAVVSITKKEEEAKKKTAAKEENKLAKEEKTKEEKAAAVEA
ncbi:hypothetical protein NDA18_003460 [Ustilago nuda]|nr:hypothetical protein NDA18_003460 [Ustilago nuda]